MQAADPGLRPFALLAGFAYYSLVGGWLDTALLLFSAWRNKHALANAVSEYIDPRDFQRQLFLLPGFALGLVFLEICRCFLSLADTDSKKWTTPVRPLLIPCKTTHRRTFPKKHDFAYSYLVVGIPVGWKGTYAGMVSSGVEKRSWLSWFSLVPRPSKGWFDVDAADYLERGNGHLGLRGKLDSYLKSQVCW